MVYPRGYIFIYKKYILLIINSTFAGILKDLLRTCSPLSPVLVMAAKHDSDSDSKLDDSTLQYYQGYRPTDALERQRAEWTAREDEEQRKALEQERRELELENQSKEELDRRRLAAVGKTTHRRGGSSLDPEKKERAEWYVTMEEKAFKEAKERMLREESALRNKKGDEHKGEGHADADHKDLGHAETGAEDKEPDTVPAESSKTSAAAEELLKPKFSNFLLDLGNESAERKAEEEVQAKSKKKSRVPKPLPETYSRPVDFAASKWVIKLSGELSNVRARLICFPCIGMRCTISYFGIFPAHITTHCSSLLSPITGGTATTYRRWACRLKPYDIEVYAVQMVRPLSSFL